MYREEIRCVAFWLTVFLIVMILFGVFDEIVHLKEWSSP